MSTYNEYEPKEEGGYAFPGMTLRDYFAGRALTTLTPKSPDDYAAMALIAYKLADAMLAERLKPRQPS